MAPCLTATHAPIFGLLPQPRSHLCGKGAPLFFVLPSMFLSVYLSLSSPSEEGQGCCAGWDAKFSGVSLQLSAVGPEWLGLKSALIKPYRMIARLSLRASRFACLSLHRRPRVSSLSFLCLIISESLAGFRVSNSGGMESEKKGRGLYCTSPKNRGPSTVCAPSVSRDS